MSAIVPAALPVAGHAAPKPVVRIDVTLFNRTKGFENTPQFAPWMTTFAVYGTSKIYVHRKYM